MRIKMNKGTMSFKFKTVSWALFYHCAYVDFLQSLLVPLSEELESVDSRVKHYFSDGVEILLHGEGEELISNREELWEVLNSLEFEIKYLTFQIEELREIEREDLPYNPENFELNFHPEFSYYHNANVLEILQGDEYGLELVGGSSLI